MRRTCQQENPASRLAQLPESLGSAKFPRNLLITVASRSTVTDAGKGTTRVGRKFCESVWIMVDRLRSTCAACCDPSETDAPAGWRATPRAPDRLPKTFREPDEHRAQPSFLALRHPRLFSVPPMSTSSREAQGPFLLCALSRLTGKRLFRYSSPLLQERVSATAD
jgi:hypothetical protein